MSTRSKEGDGQLLLGARSALPHMSSSSSKILEDAGSRCVKCPPLSDFQRIKRPDVIEADSERVGPINVGKLRTSEPQGP
jgi:hypothetical protein